MMKRTHRCQEVTEAFIGKIVTVIGWIARIRNHGGLIFIDLRDRSGLVQLRIDIVGAQQLAFNPAELREESVICSTGIVEARPENTVNTRLASGAIEINVQSFELLNTAEVLPFRVDDTQIEKINEELKLHYRFLELRCPKTQKAFEIRHRAAQLIRRYLDQQSFWEVDLPILFKSTPEGAREFLVPSRIHPGQFYALTQSPQQYKQMLMVSGFERYFSLARCFRDEDLRADRQPEFTQLDLEMSFIEREDIYQLIEGLLSLLWKELLGIEIKTPFLRMPYLEAMQRFGSDKPDLRFDLEIQDLSKTFENTQCKLFAETLAHGETIQALNAKQLADLSQKELAFLETTAKALGAKGLAFIKRENGELKSPLLRFFTEEEKTQLTSSVQLEEGDILFFALGSMEKACSILGRIRIEAANLLRQKQRLKFKDYQFLWVIDFPLVSFDETTERYVSTHHPFTAPVNEDISLLDEHPTKVRAQHYDIVLNGTELGGGSIRIHSPELQEKIFKNVLNLPAEVIESRFSYLLHAFKFGTPPHGGIALGFDRLIALLAGTQSIREVIAFPKTQRGQDLLCNAPDFVEEQQLKELSIQVIKPSAED